MSARSGLAPAIRELAALTAEVTGTPVGPQDYQGAMFTFLSHRFGWTPNEVGNLSPGQALLYMREAAEAMRQKSASRDAPGGLNATQRRAYVLIRDEGPILGKTLAKSLQIELGSLRRHVLPPLREHGVTNDRDGEGYYLKP